MGKVYENPIDVPDGVYNVRLYSGGEHRAEKIDGIWYFSDGTGQRDRLEHQQEIVEASEVLDLPSPQEKPPENPADRILHAIEAEECHLGPGEEITKLLLGREVVKELIATVPVRLAPASAREVFGYKFDIIRGADANSVYVMKQKSLAIKI